MIVCSCEKEFGDWTPDGAEEKFDKHIESVIE